MKKINLISILKNTAAIVILVCLLIIVFYENRNLFRKDYAKELKSKDKNTNIMQTYVGEDLKRVGSNVVMITSDTYAVFDKRGKSKERKITVSNPFIHTDGSYAIYYGDGAKEAFVNKNDDECYRIQTQNKIIKCKVNRNGYAVVVTEKDGYSGEIIAYNNIGEAIFKWNVSESRFLDTDISADNKKIAVSVVTVNKKAMQATVSIIDVTNAKIIEKETVKGGVYYTVDFNRNGTVTAVGSHFLSFFNSNGSLKWTKKYGNRELIKANAEYCDMITLAFSTPDSGFRGHTTQVVVIDRLGKETATKKYSGIIDDIDISDDSIALVFGKDIIVTNNKLKTIKHRESDASIKKAVFCDGGDSIFVMGNTGVKIIE